MITVKKCFTLKKSQLGRKFRVENNNLDISALIENSGLTAKRVGEIASSHRHERDRKKTANETFKYVQISDIDVLLGRIKSYRKFLGSEAPNNARRIMSYGDVIISTRRPTRGAVVAVPKEFDQEICTVFFTTLTVNDWDEVDPWYLALFLRTSLGRFQFQSMITETAYPVISDEDVESMIVLYPPIEAQREIAKAYDLAVKEFFSKLNEAYASITSSRQKIEGIILGDEAEHLETPRFGIEVEEITDENEEGEEVEVA
jgi:restriction endonuclease S subunit